MTLALLLGGLGLAAQVTAQHMPPITPTLFFNVTLYATDGFQYYSPDDWTAVNSSRGWVQLSRASSVRETDSPRVSVSQPLYRSPPSP